MVQDAAYPHDVLYACGVDQQFVRQGLFLGPELDVDISVDHYNVAGWQVACWLCVLIWVDWVTSKHLDLDWVILLEEDEISVWHIWWRILSTSPSDAGLMSSVLARISCLARPMAPLRYFSSVAVAILDHLSVTL